MNRLCGDRMATSLRYGFVEAELLACHLLGCLLIELLEVLVMLAGRLLAALMVALGDEEDGRRTPR